MDLLTKALSKAVAVGDCWVSQRAGVGYGTRVYPVVWRGKKAVQASRVVAGLADVSFRAGPDTPVADHLCGNTRCVRPTHLKVVTMRENSTRRWA